MAILLFILLWFAFFALFLFVVLYVTWLFITRLRAGESKPKSFLRWLRELFDAVSGLG